MIDIEKIKSLPEDKPRKGPHRMSKSEKSRAQACYKAEQRARRRIEYYRSLSLWVDRRGPTPLTRRLSLGEEEFAHFRERIFRALKVPVEYLDPLALTTATREGHD